MAERDLVKKRVIEESEEERARRVADDEEQGYTISEKRGSLQRLLERQVQGAVSALDDEVSQSSICQNPVIELLTNGLFWMS